MDSIMEGHLHFGAIFILFFYCPLFKQVKLSEIKHFFYRSDLAKMQHYISLEEHKTMCWQQLKTFTTQFFL